MVGKTRKVMSASFVTGAHNPDTATAIGGDEFFAPTKLHRHPEARARSTSLERWKQARCMNIGNHPLEDSCQEAIPPPCTTFDTFFPWRSRLANSPPTWGLRRIPVFFCVVSPRGA